MPPIFAGAPVGNTRHTYAFKYHSPINNLEAVKCETDIDGCRNVDTLLGDAANAFDYCSQLWDAPQINWDGALLGCCTNNMRTFDNVLEVGLQRALNLLRAGVQSGKHTRRTPM